MFVPRDMSERSLSECILTEIAYHIYKLEGPVDEVRPRAFFAAERASRQPSTKPPNTGAEKPLENLAFLQLVQPVVL